MPKSDSVVLELFRSRVVQIGAFFCLATCGAYGFLPQFGGPGYEAALAAGAVLPALTALTVAADLRRARVEPIEAYARGVAIGGLFALLGLGSVLAHGLRVGFCDATWGIELFLLGPAPGAVLGGVWGAAVGLLAGRAVTRRRRILLCVLGALAGPLAGIGISLWRFYSSPMVFAFDPFFGYFSGPLYDTVIDPVWALLTYRSGSLLTLLAAGAFAFEFRRQPDGQLAWKRSVPIGVRIAGGLFALASLLITRAGPSLGHYSTVYSIEQALGRTLSSRRCDMVYSSALLERDVRLLGRDCDAALGEVETYFGAAGPERVKVYLFANEGEKGRLMGASGTYIAKPWRREIYLNYAAYPHPVITHELAHVVAGSFGRGPFRVAGPLAGLIPDPGRIEGVAVAAAPSDNDDFTLDEWTRALLELGLLPPLERVFRLSFLGQNASTAYTVAGGFVHWFKDRYGAAALRRWYGGEELVVLTHQNLSELDREWRKSLETVKLAPALLYEARVRFDRPALFGRICPRIVDRLQGIANQRLGVADSRGAREAFNELLRLDPHHVGARLGLAACSLRAGDAEAARSAYMSLASARDFAKLEQAAALEAAADIDLRTGELERARSGYDAVAALVADEDRLRTLDVKRLPTTDIERRAVVDLLIGDPLLGPSWDVAAPKLAEWAEREPEAGVPRYLLGKNLYGRGRWQDAAHYLDAALARRIELPRVEREALRTRLITACALGEPEVAARVADTLLADPGLYPARRHAIERLARRCAATQAP